jgi:hypothetical protein
LNVLIMALGRLKLMTTLLVITQKAVTLDELYNYSFHILLNKVRRMRKLEHVTCMEKYILLARKSLQRRRCRWKDGIKIYLQEIA